MLEWLLEPWPWYISGPLIGLTVPILLLLTGRNFGISSSLRHLGAACMPNTKLPYLSKNYNWRDHIGSLIFVLGVLIGGFVGNFLLSTEPGNFLPTFYASPLGALGLFAGGILIGFGTRYAGGCTSGHTIMGISSLNLSSLVATIFFFVGGLISTWFIMPLFIN
ncbi:MAG: YeeE/YedE family protein [Ardenticatenaceae bacterium]|nr:YeeE/YedE family protein [Ardenticatenaceae bacterium]MCB8946386.1 YeeE/YedE family protein [Ardenticatenaceae bacterium]